MDLKQKILKQIEKVRSNPIWEEQDKLEALYEEYYIKWCQGKGLTISRMDQKASPTFFRGM